MMFRETEINDLPTIVRLKIRMFEDAGYADLLNGNAADLIHSKYSELYHSEQAQHFVI